MKSLTRHWYLLGDWCPKIIPVLGVSVAKANQSNFKSPYEIEKISDAAFVVVDDECHISSIPEVAGLYPF